MSAPSPWVQVTGLSFSYGERATLHGLDLELPRGELSVLLGPNGAGKSTLLGLLAGVLRPRQGTIRVGESDPGALSRAAAARRVVYLPSRAEAPADYSALELVLMGRYPFGRGLLSDRPADVALASESSWPASSARRRPGPQTGLGSSSWTSRPAPKTWPIACPSSPSCGTWPRLSSGSCSWRATP